MSARTAAFCTILVAALAACTPSVMEWSETQAPKENRVEFVRLSHTVRFAPGAAIPSAEEARRLSGFLGEAGIAGGDRVLVRAAPGDRLAQQRAAFLAGDLRRNGVILQAAPDHGGPAARGDEMILLVERYVVTPPHCPDWSKPPGADYSNALPSNFGCATATNLGLMVADPRDLVVGRDPGPAEGDPAIRPVERYRTGKVQRLPAETSSRNATPVSPDKKEQ